MSKIRLDENVIPLSVSEESGQSSPDNLIHHKNLIITNVGKQKWQPKIVMQPYLGYLKQKLGILNILQALFSIICLTALVTSGIWHSGHDRDDRELWWWRYRLLIFVSVFGSLISISSIIVNVSSMNKILLIDWSLYNIVVYMFICFLYLIVGSLVFDSNFGFHHTERGNPPAEWSHKHMAGAVICSFICFVLFGTSAIISYKTFKKENSMNLIDGECGKMGQRFQLVEKKSNSTVMEST